MAQAESSLVVQIRRLTLPYEWRQNWKTEAFLNDFFGCLLYSLVEFLGICCKQLGFVVQWCSVILMIKPMQQRFCGHNHESKLRRSINEVQACSFLGGVVFVVLVWVSPTMYQSWEERLCSRGLSVPSLWSRQLFSFDTFRKFLVNAAPLFTKHVIIFLGCRSCWWVVLNSAFDGAYRS